MHEIAVNEWNEWMNEWIEFEWTWMMMMDGFIFILWNLNESKHNE